jgi:hypothetical protein
MQKYLLSAQNVSRLICSFILVFIVLFWYLSFDGFYFYDDYNYCLYASQLAEGKFSLLDDIFSHRLLVFFPIAILYKFFGINDFTSTVWPLTVTLGTVMLVFILLRNSPSKATAAVVLLGLSYYPIFFSNKVYPDSIVSFFSFLSVIILYKADTGRYNMKAAAFVMAVFCAFLSKETVIYFFLFYLIVFISDIYSGLNKKFWLATGLIALIIFSGYFISYKILTGSYFFRFEAIENGHYAFPLSYFQKSFIEFIPRLTYEPLLMMVSSEMIIPFILSIPCLVTFRFNQLKNLRDEKVFWTTLVICLLLMIWFWTTSLRDYNPVSLLPRMFILLMPPLSVLAAVSINEFILKRSTLLLMAILFFICSVLAYYFGIKSYIIYILIGATFVLIYLVNNKLEKEKLSIVFIFLMCLVSVIHPSYTMFKPSQSGYFSEKKIIDKYLKGGEGSNLVITDGQLCSGHLFYYEFKPNRHYQYLNYKQVNATDLKAYRYFILINRHSFDLFHSMGDPYPECYAAIPDSWKLKGGEGNVKLYEAGSLEEVKAGF